MEPQPRTDLLQTLMDMRYEDGAELTDTEITGILIGAVFAGHHTSAGTAAWLLIELLRNPALLTSVRAEIDLSGEPTAQTLREMPVLEGALKEVLRLHPPVIILMRRVLEDLTVGDYTIPAGDLVWASPPVTHRLSAHFPDPDRFDASRYDAGRREDRNVMAYQPFGGGKHRCAGSGFAAFQIKAIFAVLLRRYEFELVHEPSSYTDDYRQMIVQPRVPSLIRYQPRGSSVVSS
jgi:sterol 14-demethylase